MIILVLKLRLALGLCIVAEFVIPIHSYTNPLALVSPYNPLFICVIFK